MIENFWTDDNLITEAIALYARQDYDGAFRKFLEADPAGEISLDEAAPVLEGEVAVLLGVLREKNQPAALIAAFENLDYTDINSKANQKAFAIDPNFNGDQDLIDVFNEAFKKFEIIRQGNLLALSTHVELDFYASMQEVCEAVMDEYDIPYKAPHNNEQGAPRPSETYEGSTQGQDNASNVPTNFKAYIDDYMNKHGSKDPAENEKAQRACGQHLLEVLQAAPEEFSAPGELPTTLGILYAYLGLEREAIEYNAVALKITPDDPELIINQIELLLNLPDKTAAFEFIEKTLNSLQEDETSNFTVALRTSCLIALAESEQYNCPAYTATLDYMLETQPNNISTHVFAARKHVFNNEKIKFVHHMARFVELTRDNEVENDEFGFDKQSLALIATATELAIEFQDKKKTWLFIAHLMNSNHDPAAVLALREAAAQAFPPVIKGHPDNGR